MRDALQHVGGAISHSGIVVPHQFDQAGHAARQTADPRGDLRNSSEVQGVLADSQFRAQIDSLRHPTPPHPLCYETAATGSDLAATRPTPLKMDLIGQAPSASEKNISPGRRTSGR